MLDDIALFIHIVQAGGLGAAAMRLKVPPATVTRRLRKLEESVGCQLIHRSARKFVLTAEGEAYYQSFGPLVHQFEDTQRSLSADLQQLRGGLTAAAPTNLSLKLLYPMWASFIQRHPNIRLDLRLSNHLSDLPSEQVDIALRVGPQPDSLLTQKRIGTVKTALVAAPGYIDRQGEPVVHGELVSHPVIAVCVLPGWELENTTTGERALLQLTAATSVDDIGMASQLACNGLGVALLPVSEVVEEIRTGRLVHILKDWSGPEREIFAVWPSGRLLSARARCLRDHMQAYISNVPVLQGGMPTAD